MGLFEWKDSYSVGIEKIDNQHKVLIQMINMFYDEIHKIHEGKSDITLKELRVSTIDEMKKYAIEHFQTEEDLFLEYGYPDYVAHKTKHDDFFKKVLDVEKRLENGSLILSTEITDFLKEWLVEHIEGCDQEYSEYLVSRGAK